MSGFMYFSCILTGVLSGSALGMVGGILLTREPWGKWAGAAVGALILTGILLHFGRKLQKLMNEK
jgi:ABC-type cobalamin transport system permease subunit